MEDMTVNASDFPNLDSDMNITFNSKKENKEKT